MPHGSIDAYKEPVTVEGLYASRFLADDETGAEVYHFVGSEYGAALRAGMPPPCLV
jgi:hypothetical protein